MSEISSGNYHPVVNMDALKVYLCIVIVFYFISCIRAVYGGKILCSNIASHNDYILTDCHFDCEDLLGFGVTTSGIYTVNPDDGEPFQV